MENTKYGGRQSQLNHLYNQDVAPQDSQITSFYYHKTLALESLVALFSLFSISLNLIEFVFGGVNSQYTLLTDFGLILTALGIITMIFQRLSKIRWTQQTRSVNLNIKQQILDLIVKIILFVPTPSFYTNYTFIIQTYDSQQKQMNVNSLLTFYALINRFVYVIKFLVHSQLYYGSRPDRLSRLYTVEFGTFNSIKFLINQKPLLVILTTMIFNFVILPFTILALQSQINPSLETFVACLHFVLVTQVTVGYGDLNVLSIFGRMASICIVLLGITYTSLLLILFVRAMLIIVNIKQVSFINFITQNKDHKVASTANLEGMDIFKHKKIEQINAFRYNNRRDILLDQQNNINVKRMMLSNFSEMFQYLSQIQQKHNIISKCLQVISGNQTNLQITTNSAKKKVQKRASNQASNTTIKKYKNKYQFGDDILQDL